MLAVVLSLWDGSGVDGNDKLYVAIANRVSLVAIAGQNVHGYQHSHGL